MRLVVCIDRDDDLGRKTGIAGPVVGRAAVLDAATKLGTADPEDSDTNAMFAAVRLYDELVEAGDECTVVVLTGSPKVGVLSDRRVAEQFDQVLKEVPATAAHLVSDGAEDEYLFPIVSSRVRIDGVHRVYVRQNASIESTYYTMVRALKDPKLRAKTVLPFAIVLLGLGLAAAGGFIWWGAVGLVIVLGIYLIFWTFDIDESLIDSLRSASSDVRQGSVAFGFGVFSLALVGVGFLQGFNVYIAHPSQAPIERFLSFLTAGLIWWFVGSETWESGRALRRYLAGARVPRSYPIATLSIAALGFLSYGLVYLVVYLESYSGAPILVAIVGMLLLGFSLLVVAGVLQQYLKTRATAPAPDATSAG